MTSKPKRVIVVGAGIAGLAAARALSESGYGVVVLEARDRIGGRCWTVDGVDFGAHWIHGTEGNPVTTLARRHSLEALFVGGDSSYAGGWGELAVHGPDGPLTLEEKRRSLLVMDEVRDRLESIRRQAHEVGSDDRSLHDAAASVLADLDLPEADRMHVDWHLTLLARDDFSAGTRSLSSLWWDEGYEVYGYGDSVLAQGMQALADALARGLDVRLEHEVTRIALDGDSKVCVTARGESFEADAVIVSLPLGVLKAETVAFEPPLPEQKQAAILRLGVGSMNKIVLWYPEPFWPKEQYAWGYVSRDCDDAPTTVVNLWKTHRLPALVMVLGGAMGRGLEEWSEERVQSWAVRVVGHLFGAQSPEPRRVVRTAWQADPYARGSYAYVPVGATPEDFDVLAEPIADRVFFAGEATHRHHWGCVHGAYVSGLREAARVSKDSSLLPSRHFTENRRWRDMLQRADRLFNLIGRDLDQEEIKHRTAVLAASAVFGCVPLEDLRVLASMFEPLEFAAGETICRQGERATRMFVIASGDVTVSTEGQTVASVSSADVVGEYGLFGAETRTATLTADVPTRVLALDYGRFERFLLAFPESMFALMQLTVRRLLETRRSPTYRPSLFVPTRPRR